MKITELTLALNNTSAALDRASAAITAGQANADLPTETVTALKGVTDRVTALETQVGSTPPQPAQAS